MTRSFSLLFTLLSLCTLQAQTPDSVRNLPSMTVRDTRFVRTGYAIWKADTLPNQSAIPLADRLLWENRLDVRANAPGTLATISIRGVGSSRTPVFWNGLNLQSCMNGVVDAALIPLWPEDQFEIHYGGQSAAQSSGAVAGSVSIVQGQQAEHAGFSGFAQGAAGSFGRWDAGGGLGFSGKKFSAKFRAVHQEANNDFSFQKQGLDGQFYPAKQSNNFLKKTDLQQFNQFNINEKAILKSSFWLQNAFRELPPALTESPKETWQEDRAHRAIISLDYAAKPKVIWTSKAAWLDDYLAFHLSGDTDTSRSRQVLLSTERSENLNANWAWRAGTNAIRQWAKVDGYADSTRWFGQTRLAGFAMSEFHQKNLRFSALLRQEWAEAQAAPFTWSLGGQLALGRVGDARFHISRNFNLPTLNDRFWDKLGKADIHPEKGYSADLSWVFQKEKISLECTGFQVILDDWILWQPDANGIFRPDNLRKVWSRGLEVSGKWTNTWKAWKMDLSGRMQWSKATNVEVYGGSNSVLGMQLPYTPNVSGGFSGRISRSFFSMAYLQQFTGTRLDNSGKNLEAFQVANLLFSSQFLHRRLSLDFRIENLWDADYEVLRYRPMPGRAWRLGLGYKW